MLITNAYTAMRISAAIKSKFLFWNTNILLQILQWKHSPVVGRTSWTLPAFTLSWSQLTNFASLQAASSHWMCCSNVSQSIGSPSKDGLIAVLRRYVSKAYFSNQWGKLESCPCSSLPTQNYLLASFHVLQLFISILLLMMHNGQCKTTACGMLWSFEGKNVGFANYFSFNQKKVEMEQLEMKVPRKNKGGARRYKTPSPQLLRMRRQAANARERRRMNNLNDAFDRVNLVF